MKFCSLLMPLLTCKAPNGTRRAPSDRSRLGVLGLHGHTGGICFFSSAVFTFPKTSSFPHMPLGPFSESRGRPFSTPRRRARRRRRQQATPRSHPSQGVRLFESAPSAAQTHGCCQRESVGRGGGGGGGGQWSQRGVPGRREQARFLRVAPSRLLGPSRRSGPSAVRPPRRRDERPPPGQGAPVGAGGGAAAHRADGGLAEASDPGTESSSSCTKPPHPPALSTFFQPGSLGETEARRTRGPLAGRPSPPPARPPAPP